MRLIVEGWLLLLRFEIALSFRRFQALHRLVDEEAVRVTDTANLIPSQDLCAAIDCACVLYFRRVQCLQRSAATTLLLRRHGWKAEMVIGAQLVPFNSHAWVEIDGLVVNDRPYVTEVYQVFERC